MIFRSPKLTSTQQNEIRMLQMTHIVARLTSTDPDAVTTMEILQAITKIANEASDRMNTYLPVVHVHAKTVFEKWLQGTLVCEDENLSLRGAGQYFGA